MDYGTPGSPTYSTTYTSLDEMIGNFPNNLNNEIDARRLRDALLTLWERLDTVEQINTTYYYNNSNPTTIQVGGIPTGITFSNYTLDTMFTNMFYPYLPPQTSLSFDLSGTTTRIIENGSSNSVSLYWNVIKKSNNISYIDINGNTILVNGGNQNGIYNTASAQNVNTSFTLTVIDVDGGLPSVSDGPTTVTNTINVLWRNKRYWGTINLSSLGNPDLNLSLSELTNISNLITSSTILSLTGAGVGTGSELSINLNKTYTNMNGNGNYLIFAFPSTFGNPSFIVNGLSNNAFTKVKSNFSFTNQFGYITNYDVWISNTIQNSPLNINIT